MTEKQVLRWIKSNLGPVIQQALASRPGVHYTEEWLAAMAYRETGILMLRYIPSGKDFKTISTIMRGDYSQRPGEAEKSYHGYGFWQIDVNSFADFVRSGNWKDPLKCCQKAIDVLEQKRSRLWDPETGLLKGHDYPADFMDRAITAAYNCGEGNIAAVVREGEDIDTRTHGDNYSAEVWRFRALYIELN